MYAAVLFLCSVGILYIRGCEGGYCTQYYTCSYSCYRQTTYYTNCGFLWLSRCTRYRSALDTCYKLCNRSECCTGYQGSTCDQPICFGSISCPNGGTCRAPDTCSCRTGFSGTKCSDTNLFAEISSKFRWKCISVEIYIVHSL
ncbi:delta-like protein B [Mya arenaria]|uniref:delta-like protein B n=1 Tax=Mya arenaria TaxID=6604 RepID=UPI0022E63D20|nr:delta-like protein B [Mya arenaria]